MANIFDLSVEEFQAVLPELQAQGVDVAPLMREYRRLNSALAPVYGLIDRVRGADTEAGRTRATLLPMTSPEGMSGLEAIRSGQAELAVPSGLIGMLEGGAMAADAPAAASAGLMPVEDAPMEAMGFAGTAMLGGGAMPAPSGALRAMAMRSVDEYGGTHRAPRRSNEYGASLDDPRDMFGGDDIYSSNAMRYFGHGDPAMDRQSIRAINAARSNPDAEIIVYRAVPKDLENAQINAGDWVTPSKLYAERHGEGPLGGNYQIIEQKVRAGDLFSDGDIHEWGYDPLTTSANRDAATGAVVLPAARNEAEAMARRILEMRAAGRAGDVTDEMMAAADPQYMFNNTPLPMDEASRMVRAAGQGFDLMRQMYHGTDTDFASVNTDMGSGERYKTGFFSSDNPDVAASYAPNRDLGRILPVMSRAADRGVVVDAQGANWNRIDAASPARNSSSVLSNEFPELAGDQNAYTYFSRMYDDLMGLRELSTNAMARERRFEGDPSITFENVIDRGPFSLTNDQAISASQPSTVAVDFYPRNIRSRFARFDPEFSHLANLSAANASPGVGLLQMYQQQQLEDRARRRGLLP